jgi:hypothetical protein
MICKCRKCLLNFPVEDRTVSMHWLHACRPVLLLVCDGGSDHNVMHANVQAALSGLFLAADLDMLVAVRTAPGHSYRNPVEHVMSAANVGLQNCSFMRGAMSAEFEAALEGCTSMAAVRKQLAAVPGLREAWVDSVQAPIAAIAARLMQVEWTGRKVRGGI